VEKLLGLWRKAAQYDAIYDDLGNMHLCKGKVLVTLHKDLSLFFKSSAMKS